MRRWKRRVRRLLMRGVDVAGRWDVQAGMCLRCGGAARGTERRKVWAVGTRSRQPEVCPPMDEEKDEAMGIARGEELGQQKICRREREKSRGAAGRCCPVRCLPSRQAQAMNTPPSAVAHVAVSTASTYFSGTNVASPVPHCF
jgi:hypothetical protein